MRGAQVRRLAVQPRGVAFALGRRQRPARVPLGERVALRPPPRAARAHTAARSRAGDSGARARRCSALTSDFSTSRARTSATASSSSSVARADGLGGGEVEATGEDRQAAQQQLLVVLEQVVAPLERRRKRLLARRRRRDCRCATGGSCHRAARRASPCRARRSERPRARARAAGHRGGSRSARRPPRSPRRSRTRAWRRLRDRSAAARPRSAAARSGVSRCSGSGIAIDGHSKHDLSGHAQRLTARGQDREVRRGAQQGVDHLGGRDAARARSCPEPAACVRGARKSAIPSSEERPGRAPTSSAAATVAATSRPSPTDSELDEGTALWRMRPRTRGRARERAASCRHRRRRRASAVAFAPISASSSRSSCLRPTNELVCGGSAGWSARRPSAPISASSSTRSCSISSRRVASPVVVAVFRQQFAAVERHARRGRQRMSRPGAPALLRARTRRHPRSPEASAARRAARSRLPREHAAPRAPPGGGCSQRPRDPDRARAHP